MHDSDSGMIPVLTGIGSKHLGNSWNRNWNRNQTFGKLLESESELESEIFGLESESDISALIPSLKKKYSETISSD